MWRHAFQITAVSHNSSELIVHPVHIHIQTGINTSSTLRINRVGKRQEHLNGHSRKPYVKHDPGISQCPSGPTGMDRRQVQVEYRPPLLHPLLLRHTEGVAPLVVDAPNHLLPAVVWCLRHHQLIPLWNQYRDGDAVGHFLRYTWNLSFNTLSTSALLVLDTTPFPSNLNKHSLVYGFPWPLSTTLM